MTQEEINKGNKLIAEFMGLRKDTVQSVYAQVKKLPPDLEAYEFNYRMRSPNELKFHKSWHWLMLVVEKIQALDRCRFWLHCTPHGIEVVDYITVNEAAVITYERYDREPMIEMYYETVLLFIEWHNTQKPTP